VSANEELPMSNEQLRMNDPSFSIAHCSFLIFHSGQAAGASGCSEELANKRVAGSSANPRDPATSLSSPFAP
jgi:hypothetical protein